MIAPVTRATFFAAFVRAIAAVPAGERLNIRALREPFRWSQADALATIEWLIAQGQLDAATLRPPIPMPAADDSPAAPALGYDGLPLALTGKHLFELLKTEGQKRGLTVQAVGLAVFANKARIYQLPKQAQQVRAATRLRVEAWLNSTPAVQTPAAGDCGGAAQHAKAAASPPSPPIGDSLADALTALIQRHDLSTTRVGKHLFGRAGCDHLRGSAPRQATADRVRAFLAAPPLEEFRRQRRAPSTPRRDATQKPDTPLLDHADRVRTKGMRRSAAVNRGREQTAAALVDAGVDPSTKNTVVGNAMREVIRRRADEARAADPIEQAKLALRQRGRIVFDASVDGGRAGRFFVSGQNHPDTGKRLQLTEQELIALARRVNPRALHLERAKP